jgi:hypothetical protein
MGAIAGGRCNVYWGVELLFTTIPKGKGKGEGEGNGGGSVDEKTNGTDVCAVDMFGFAVSLHLALEVSLGGQGVWQLMWTCTHVAPGEHRSDITCAYGTVVGPASRPAHLRYSRSQCVCSVP